MKLLALGSCLVCALLVFLVIQRDTEKTEASTSSSFLASPETMPQPASGSEAALPAGTVVSVALVDPIDSDHDPFAKQYAASVNLIQGRATAPGSRATVVLVNTNTGWLTQLTGLTLNGRNFQVLSGAGSVIASQQHGKASPPGMFGQMGFASATAPASTQRVLLPPATQLRFVLMGSPTVAKAVAVSRPYRSAVSIGPQPSLSPATSIAASRPEPKFAYLCRASDTPDRALPLTYYIAEVFKTSDSQALVERRWQEYVVAVYPYKFANNRHAIAQCTRLTDPAIDLNARKRSDIPENAEIVETRWHYTLGPPPAPASLPAPSTLPSRDPQ